MEVRLRKSSPGLKYTNRKKRNLFCCTKGERVTMSRREVCSNGKKQSKMYKLLPYFSTLYGKYS